MPTIKQRPGWSETMGYASARSRCLMGLSREMWMRLTTRSGRENTGRATLQFSLPLLNCDDAGLERIAPDVPLTRAVLFQRLLNTRSQRLATSLRQLRDPGRAMPQMPVGAAMRAES